MEKKYYKNKLIVIKDYVIRGFFRTALNDIFIIKTELSQDVDIDAKTKEQLELKINELNNRVRLNFEEQRRNLC